MDSYVAHSTLWATWLGAVGQCASALLLAYIGYLTYRFTKYGVRANAITYINDMASEMNKLYVSPDPGLSAAIQRLYSPVIGHQDDFILYTVFNYVEVAYKMAEDGLVDRALFDSLLDDCYRWIHSLTEEQVSQILSTGYLGGLKDEVLAYYRRKKTASYVNH